MKIVCDACQAKYSISDDKVQGKVFKIRCKKCSNIIVVRGGASVAEPAPPPQQEKDTRVYDYGYEGGDHAPAGDEAVWHVVINQDQVGPMTAVDVQRRFSSGEIDAETYIWREGFADWLPLAQVDTFAALLTSGAPASAPRSGGADAVASMFGDEAGTGGGGRSDPGDLFAAASASAGRGDDDGNDLFGGKPVAAANQGGAKMRGERNENSVLFSLNNLAQLASDKPAPAPRAGVSASPAPSVSGGGSSGGEGSGLIDIRSMASAYLGAPGSTAKPASAGIGSIDDLPVFGGGGFTEPAVIVPIAARPNNNKMLYALIGSVGVLALAAVVVVVVLITSSRRPRPSPRPSPPPSRPSPTQAPSRPPPSPHRERCPLPRRRPAAILPRHPRPPHPRPRSRRRRPPRRPPRTTRGRSTRCRCRATRRHRPLLPPRPRPPRRPTSPTRRPPLHRPRIRRPRRGPTRAAAVVATATRCRACSTATRARAAPSSRRADAGAAAVRPRRAEAEVATCPTASIAR
jgi:predicted Zn finger-like uncharacterized protein